MHRHLTRSLILIATLFLLNIATAEAQWMRHYEPSSQLRFRFGLFEPNGDSDGWDTVFEGFTGQPSDLQDFVWGADFLWLTGRHTGILFGASAYRGKTTSAYEDWQAADGGEIRHTTSLEISDLTAAFVYRFSNGPVRPYVGLGGGIVWYTLADEGEFIDFGSPDLPVIWAWYGARDTTFEVFGLAGLDIPLSHNWSFIVEARYRWAEDTLSEDFAGFGELDLSGYKISVGIGISF